MGFNVKRSIVSVNIFFSFEPFLGVEILRLQSELALSYKQQQSTVDLLHIPKNFLSTPSWHIPIIVILLRSSDAQSAIDTTRPTKKLPTTDFDLTSIGTWVGFRYNVPVGVRVEILRPFGIRNC